MRVKKTKLPQDLSKAEYLRYFAELGAEYDARAQRMEARLLSGNAVRGSPDLKGISVDKPTWEIDDVCCFTDASEPELQSVLIPLFDGYRRYERAHRALAVSDFVASKDRRAVIAFGLDAVLSTYMDRQAVDDSTEETIDGWLDRMVGPCRWAGDGHKGRRCRKPVPWAKEDMGGGRSKPPTGPVDAQPECADCGSRDGSWFIRKTTRTWHCVRCHWRNPAPEAGRYSDVWECGTTYELVRWMRIADFLHVARAERGTTGRPVTTIQHEKKEKIDD